MRLPPATAGLLWALGIGFLLQNFLPEPLLMYFALWPLGQYTAGVSAEGDIITVDGTTGEALVGAADMLPPGLDDTFRTLLGWADEFRDIGIRANADTPADAATARIDLSSAGWQAAAGRVGQRLRALGCEPLLGYAGGLFIWVRLPPGCDAQALARTQAAKRLKNEGYKQVSLKTLPGNSAAEQEQLYRRIRGWLSPQAAD